jgi:2-dehydro-3-deoxygluconokinase
LRAGCQRFNIVVMLLEFPRNPRICVLGEGMIELRREVSGWQVGFGGDAINVAIHLARSGLHVQLVSALGDDPFSDELRDQWNVQGVRTDLIRSIPEALPGLYAIHVDAVGERSFRYWRRDSAATRLFSDGVDPIVQAVSEADALVYSLISLAILPEPDRAAVFALCEAVRSRGGKVVFDGNYRPALWPDLDTARAARDRAIACCDIGLPTQSDEEAMGEPGDARATAQRWQALGAAEIVVKLGPEGCLVEGAIVAPEPIEQVIDTSGAGDAFDAGYLSARLRGFASADAARQGHALAGWVIRSRGAIPARDAEAPYPHADPLPCA